MINSKEKTIYFITGASGVGKTTLVQNLEKTYKNKPWKFLHFDSIGVPTLSQMQRDFGSPSNWQKTKTAEWIDKLVRDYPNEKIFFEGQVNLEFIKNGFERHHFHNYKIILIDCSEAEIGHRLIHERGQPELFTDDMKNWLPYLRKQALESGALIIDSSLSEEEVVIAFEKAVGL